MNPNTNPTAMRAAEEIAKATEAASRAMNGPRFMFQEYIDEIATIISAHYQSGGVNESLAKESQELAELVCKVVEHKHGIHPASPLAQQAGLVLEMSKAAIASAASVPMDEMTERLKWLVYSADNEFFNNLPDDFGLACQAIDHARKQEGGG